MEKKTKKSSGEILKYCNPNILFYFADKIGYFFYFH